MLIFVLSTSYVVGLVTNSRAVFEMFDPLLLSHLSKSLDICVQGTIYLFLFNCCEYAIIAEGEIKGEYDRL